MAELEAASGVLAKQSADRIAKAEAAAAARADAVEGLRAQLAALQLASADDAKTAAKRAEEADGLRQRVAALEAASSTTAKETADRIARAEATAATQTKAVEELRKQLAAVQLASADDAKMAAKRAEEADGLRQKVAELETASDASAKEAADRVAHAEAAAAVKDKAVDGLREQLAALQLSARNEAKAAAEQLAAAEQDGKARDGAMADLRSEADGLKGEIFHLNELLASAETTVDSQQEKIDGLDAQLNEALARKVEELEKYRSEFFGRLREALGDRPDLRVVGDRFVFQSELLFASGSATLDPDGQAQLRQLARTLQEVAASIPPELDWVLRVDGHTDRQPIRDAAFHSNWELSTARAISVIEFLIDQGIPPQHLAAAGFGEYRPIDTRDDEAAYRRNRRIEFKLTEG